MKKEVMLRYFLRRLFSLLPMLFLISLICFGVSKLTPGDYLDQLRSNPSIRQETIARERVRLGLDRPVVAQYFIWAGNLLKGDLGQSFRYRVPVNTLIGSRILNTLVLSIATLIFVWLIALPLGIWLAVRQHSALDQIVSTLSYFFLGVPSFFLALVFLWFAVRTGGLPSGGMQSPGFADLSFFGKVLDILWHLLIPVLAGGLGGIAALQRRMRGNLLDVLGEEYVRTARAKGLPEHKVIYRHAVRNAINPLVTLLGFEFAALLSGNALVEIVLSWPGLGMMMLDALTGQDFNLALAGMMIGALMLLLGNLLADLLLAWLDPRIKLEA
ncbi:MAG TPA: ABC transporter substrate-binding protein [Cyanobacteria bacterium UBA8530]|nr:ABC transporter substrate-binding protein [Cyanobacteria bacterium UBA8530]